MATGQRIGTPQLVFLGAESFRQLGPSISLTCDRQQAHDSGSVRQVARWNSGQLWRVVETKRVREGKGWMERQGSRQDFGRGDSRSWVGPDGALAINVLSVCTVPTRHGPLYSLDYDYDFQATQCLKREATATAATGEPPNFLFLLVVVVDVFFFFCLGCCVRV